MSAGLALRPAARSTRRRVADAAPAWPRCSSGIGFATVQHLARRGAKVYIATRSEARGRDAVARLHAQGLETVAWHALDLGDPRAAKKSAEEFAKREARLDVLGASCGCWASHTALVRRADNGNVPRPQ